MESRHVTSRHVPRDAIDETDDEVDATESRVRRKRAVWLLPAFWVGVRVAPHVYRFLVYLFGAAAVTTAGITVYQQTFRGKGQF